MNAVVIALFALISFSLAYKFYASFLSRKIFELNPQNITPAHHLHEGSGKRRIENILTAGNQRH